MKEPYIKEYINMKIVDDKITCIVEQYLDDVETTDDETSDLIYWNIIIELIYEVFIYTYNNKYLNYTNRVVTYYTFPNKFL